MKKMVSVVLALIMVMTFALPALADANTITVGVIGPMTGGAAIYGKAVERGAMIAAEEINALGGIQIVLDVQDDEHDTEKAINAYNATMDNGAQLIIGNVTSKPCEAVGPVAFEERVFMLTPSASSVATTEGKDNVYQICFSDPNQGLASADYIATHNLAKKVAVIYNNGDVYSSGIYQTFEAKAIEMGLEVVSVTTFPDDNTTDFSVQLTEAKNSGAELVFLPIYYTPASMILTQAKGMDYAPIFFGVDGMDGILTMEGFDTSLAEGVLLLTPFSADAQDEKTQMFVAKYNELYGETPNQFAADAYDAVYAVAKAATNAGITSDTPYDEVCELMIEQMQTLQLDGITGSMTWDATGAVSKTPMAVQIQNGAYVGME